MKYAKINQQWIDSDTCTVWIKIKVSDAQAEKIRLSNEIEQRKIIALNKQHQQESEFWVKIESSTNLQAFNSYIKKYPNGLFLNNIMG